MDKKQFDEKVKQRIDKLIPLPDEIQHLSPLISYYKAGAGAAYEILSEEIDRLKRHIPGSQMKEMKDDFDD